MAAIELHVPRLSATEDHVTLVEWRLADGAPVDAAAVVAVLETSKATLELEAPRAGWLFHAARAGSEVAVGATIGVVGEEPERPPHPGADTRGQPGPAAVVTAPAHALLRQHGLSAADFRGREVIRASDVEALLGAQGERRGPTSAGQPLDPAGGWDAAVTSPAHLAMTAHLDALRRRMRARFDRHVPIGALLHDRWELARELGFGARTSVYDDCLVLGDVAVGADCWIGPFVVLDGAHAPLRIGAHTQIGSGSQLYTHNTIAHTLSGGRLPAVHAPTSIGRACFIAPLSVIGPGTTLGDESLVAAGSYVEGVFPPRSYLAGSPAARIGWVEIGGDGVVLRRDR